MKNSICLVILLSLSPIAALHASEGGSSGGGMSMPVVKLTPEQKAAASYESGMAHRNRAAKLEDQARSQSNSKKLAKLQKKIAKEYKNAIRDYESAIRYVPRFYEIHSSLGYVLRKVGRYEESLAAYNESLRINPEYGEAIEYRAEAYLGLNRVDEAKQAYMSLFQGDPKLANELLSAMITWVSERRENASGLDESVIEQFAAWIDQRGELASYIQHTDSSTAGRWEE